MMKREIVIPLIIGTAAALLSFISMRQCSSSEGMPTIQAIVQTDTVWLQSDTIVLPGSVTAVLTPVHDTALYRKLRDSLADMHTSLDSIFLAVSQFSALTVRADSILHRTAAIYSQGSVIQVQYLDTMHIEYKFPPANRFAITHGNSRFETPPDSIQLFRCTPRPWWIDIAIGVTSALLSWLASESH